MSFVDLNGYCWIVIGFVIDTAKIRCARELLCLRNRKRERPLWYILV